MSHIPASFDTLLRQAPYTAHNYLTAAISDIEEQFGEGYAAKHPELVAAYMQVCASDFECSANNKIFESSITELCWAIKETFQAFSNETPNFNHYIEKAD